MWGLTDRQTNQTTNRSTVKESYRGAWSRLKILVWGPEEPLINPKGQKAKRPKSPQYEKKFLIMGNNRPYLGRTTKN
jgi:hypothetical protein